MEQFYTLSDDNYVMYAMKHYNNPACKTIHEFEKDLNRFVIIKKQLNREFNVHVVLNNIRIQYNVFEPNACTDLLFFRCHRTSWPKLKTFIVFLNYMPENTHVDVPLDDCLVSQLRSL